VQEPTAIVNAITLQQGFQRRHLELAGRAPSSAPPPKALRRRARLAGQEGGDELLKLM